MREEDGQVVALKVLRGELSHDETYRRRLIHEARAAGEVRHKHLVPVDTGSRPRRLSRGLGLGRLQGAGEGPHPAAPTATAYAQMIRLASGAGGAVS